MLKFLLKKSILKLIYFFYSNDKKFHAFKNVLKCKFVNSKSFIFFSNHLNQDLRASTPFYFYRSNKSATKKNIIYVNTDALKEFYKIYFKKINYDFILITGDSDTPLVKNNFFFREIIKNKFLKKWYAQNCEVKNTKIQQIPIGLDLISQFHDPHKIFFKLKSKLKPKIYENKMINIIKKSNNFQKRIDKIYCNFQFSLNKQRKQCYNQLNKQICYFPNKRLNQLENFLFQSKFKFVACPVGEGQDTHRVWESLIFGNIPIVKSGPLDNLYEGLPVIITKSWKDLNLEIMDKYSNNFDNKIYKYEKLLSDYWRSIIFKINYQKKINNYRAFKKYLKTGI